MIQLRSILEVADNTGARKAAMISKKGQITTTAGVGDVIFRGARLRELPPAASPRR